MKKRLLKPPRHDREVLCIPGAHTLKQAARGGRVVGTCHQPYFFNPGVSVRFLLTEMLPAHNKALLFMDTDRVKLKAGIPRPDGKPGTLTLVNTGRALYNYQLPERGRIERFFSEVEAEVREHLPGQAESILAQVGRYKKIFLQNSTATLLKQALADSFMQFYGIKGSYRFLSQVLNTEPYREFLWKIYENDHRFRSVYNQALDDYKKNFRFRYKNFPFPKLTEGELPFWVVKNGERNPLFKQTISSEELKDCLCFPKASPLTAFLRLYHTDMFIHGVGGGNYEWVNDRIIEDFFKNSPPPYFVVSATFHIHPSGERSYPYFFLDPEVPRNSAASLLD
ncbi:MAG: hypothetical protein ACOC7U_09535 [Spirochaetota bacterium]